MSLIELMTVVPPPATPNHKGSVRSWGEVEKILGTLLPDDYKEFIDAYGSGSIRDDTVRLIFKSPRGIDAHFEQVVDDGSFAASSAFESDDPGERAYEVHPASPGLLRFAGDDNGKYIYWLTAGPPGEWPIVILREDGYYEQHPGPFVKFFVDLLQRRIDSQMYPRERFFCDPSKLHFVPSK